MKKILALLVNLFLILSVQAQDDDGFNPSDNRKSIGEVVPIELYIRLQNTANQPVSYCNISLKEKKSGQILNNITDKKGKVQFTLNKGCSYAVNFDNVENYITIDVPDKNYGYLTRTIIYNPPLKTANNQKVSYPDTIKQDLELNVRPTATESIVKIMLVDNSNRGVARQKVRVYSKEINRVYVTSTDGKGEATFLLPIGKKYDVGIDEFDKFHTFAVKSIPNGGMGMRLPFAKTAVTETLINDTITQQLPPVAKASTSRVLVKLKIFSLTDKKPLPNENIYFNIIDSNRVYKTKTDRNGNAQILLPKGERYSLNFKYERDVDLLEYPMTPDLHTTEIEYSYMGTVKIETHFKEAGRDKNGYKIEFLESKVEPQTFDNQLFEKTETGFNINFPKADILTPLFGDERVFVGSGYYSHNFYAFDAKTGRYRWGLALADNGPSAALYADGVVVMITESCTLYAIDALSGKLLWAKWLAGYMYSTPTVVNGKVIAVYPDANFTFNKKKLDPFVLVAFDLRTGKIAWQNRMDAEILGSAVAYKESIYLTTHNGSVYQFDEKTGAKKNELIGSKAVTSPTVLADKLFVSLASKTDSTRQEMTILDRNTLKETKRLSNLGGKLYFKNPKDISTANIMSYEGSRIVHYKGKNYNTINGKLICSDANTGATIWEKKIEKTGVDIDKIDVPIASMPVIANGNVIISTFFGEIQIYDAQTGTLKKKFDTNNQLTSQAVVNNGWIYSGSPSGKFISINSGLKDLTGWGMWSLNPEHNPVIE